MKKWIAVAVLMIFLLAGGAGAAYGQEMPDFIRVGIKSVSLDHTSSVASSDGLAVYRYENGNVSLVQAFSNVSMGKIQVTSQVVSLLDPAGEVLYTFSMGETCCIGPADVENTIWEVDGAKYRGAMMYLKTSGSDAAQMIDVIPFEKYLYGVLPKEMSSSYPLEALKAQAVAARCFAALSGTSHQSSGYDVCTSTHCQVYGGVSSEAAKCTQAVDETAGVYARVNGEPVACYYSANNGGYINACKDVWGSDISYLQAKEDPYNPDYTWTETFTASQLSSMLKDAGKDVGTVTAVAILEKGDSGCVTKMQFTGTNGTAVFEKEKIRTFLGLKSQTFEITAGGTSGSGSGGNGSVFLQDSLTAGGYQALNGLYVLSSGGKTMLDTAAGIYGVDRNTTSAIGETVNDTVSQSGTFTSMTLTGKGNGHGIGLSQQGAKAMADQGMSYVEILKFYFTGIEVY